MAFSHPTHPWRKMNLELLIVLTVSLLLILSVVIINRLQEMPRERAVPAPVMAAPTVPLHFSKLQGSTSITESSARPLPVHLTQTPLANALQELLAGPTAAEKEAGFYSEIPQGTRLLNVKVQNNAVHINLSKEFVQGGGSTSIIQRVQELKDTVQAVQGTQQLNIAIEGKPLNVLGGEGLELN
jgi:spore germination protein GerM